MSDEQIPLLRADALLENDQLTTSKKFKTSEHDQATPSTSQVWNSVSLPSFTKLWGEFSSLELFLRSTKYGMGLISKYESNKNFSAADRQKLVQFLMQHLMENNVNLKNSVFQAVSECISSTFPTEDKFTYYTPHKKKNSSGKLVDRYRNQLKNFNINSSRSKRGSPKPSAAPPSTDVQNKISWLKSSHEPWSTVQEYLAETRSVRLSERGDIGPIASFLDKWPVLRCELRYTLLTINFYS